jgi:hypothetical protein
MCGACKGKQEAGGDQEGGRRACADFAMVVWVNLKWWPQQQQQQQQPYLQLPDGLLPSCLKGLQLLCEC